MAQQHHHEKLAQEMAGTYQSMLLNSLPGIADAMRRGRGSASLTVTAQFKENKEQQIRVTLKPRERVPLEPVELVLKIADRQLALFPEGELDEDDDE